MRNVIQVGWRLAQCNIHINAQWHLFDSFRQRLADAVQMAGSTAFRLCISCFLSMQFGADFHDLSRLTDLAASLTSGDSAALQVNAAYVLSPAASL